MIDGGGLAWKWTRGGSQRLSPAQLLPRVNGQPAGVGPGALGPGRAPSAERVRGEPCNVPLARRRVSAGAPKNCPGRAASCPGPRWLVGWLLVAMSLSDHRPSTVPSRPMCSFTIPQRRRERTMCPFLLKQSSQGAWSRSCDEPLRPIALAEARSAACILGQSSGRSVVTG